MNLWIRSQDKNFLMKIEDLFYADLTGEDKRHCIISQGTELGTYETEERCIEILDEIQKILKSRLLITNATEDQAKIVAKELGYRNYINSMQLSTIKPISECLVYEMPKE